MNELSITGRFEDGVIKLSEMPRSLQVFENKDLEITIRELSTKRSDAQNRYYWASLVNDIRDFIKDTQGEKVSKEDVHEYILREVLGIKPEIKTILGREVVVLSYKRTSDMNKSEFSDLIEKIFLHFGEMGCPLREPNFIMK